MDNKISVTSLGYILKMFPSNLCSARNETEPRFCRNLIMSSLEDSAPLSLLGTGAADPPSGVRALRSYILDVFGTREFGKTKDVLRI